jgi:signal peptidase I
MSLSPIRLARRAVSLIGIALLLVLIGFSALSNLAPLAGREVFVIIGGSMEPAIPLGAMVVTTPTDPSALRVGDVITHRADNGTVVTHRIVRVSEASDGRSFETMGDANDNPDAGLVPSDTVVGLAAHYLPYAGYAGAFLSTGPGVVAALAPLVALFVVHWLLGKLEAPASTVIPGRQLTS